jgi:hypothetical protein
MRGKSTIKIDGVKISIEYKYNSNPMPVHCWHWADNTCHAHASTCGKCEDFNPIVTCSDGIEEWRTDLNSFRQ